MLAATWFATLSWSTIATSSPNVFSLDRTLLSADESCIVVAVFSTSCSSSASALPDSPPVEDASESSSADASPGSPPSDSASTSLSTASLSPTCVVLAVLSPVSITLVCSLISSEIRLLHLIGLQIVHLIGFGLGLALLLALLLVLFLVQFLR
jgi:hypothetical protein